MLHTEPAVPSINPPGIAQQCRHAAVLLADEATSTACLVHDLVGQLDRSQQFKLLAEVAAITHQMHELANWICDTSDVPERNR
jgi:hypothetical protein